MKRATRRREKAAARGPAAADVRDGHTQIWIRVAVIVVAGVLAYAGGLTHPFVFDDMGSVVMNPTIRDFSLTQVLMPPAETPVGGRPLVNLSFALNYAWGGLDVTSYHLVNILLHVTCGALVLGLVRRTLLLIGSQQSLPFAFAVALLWTVHPLNSEVVNYMTQRSESLMALCYLITLYAAARSHDAPEPGRWRLTAIVACAAGMACKESMVTAPLMVVFYDRAFVYGSLREAFAKRGQLYLGLAAAWLVLGALMLSVPRTSGAGFATTHVSWWTYLLNQSVMITRYLRLAVWPDALVLNYGWAYPQTLTQVWPYALFVSSLAIGALAWLGRSIRLGFLAVAVFVTLAPASSVVAIASEVGAERRMYLPMVALVPLMLLAVLWIWARVPGAPRLGRGSGRAGAASYQLEGGRDLMAGPFPAGATLVVLLLALVLGVRTAARTAEYVTPLRLAETIDARWPTPGGSSMLGTELVRVGRPAEAIPHLREAADGMPPVRFNLGSALIEIGERDRGIAELERFVRDEPNLATTRDARLLLARAFTERADVSNAVEQLNMLLAADPSDSTAHGLLAEALASRADFAAAVPHFQSYLAMQPQDANGWTGLGIALVSEDRVEEAIAAFSQAVAIMPGHPGFRLNLARVMFDHGNVAQALEHAKAAASLAPNDPAAQELFALIQKGR